MFKHEGSDEDGVGHGIMGTGEDDLIFIWFEGGRDSGNGNLDRSEEIAVSRLFGGHKTSIALGVYNKRAMSAEVVGLPFYPERKGGSQWQEVVGFPNVLVWGRDGGDLKKSRLDMGVLLRLKLHRLGLCGMPTGVMSSGWGVVGNEGFVEFRKWAGEVEGKLPPNLIVRMRLPRPEGVGVKVGSFRNPICLVSFSGGRARFADLWVEEGKEGQEFDCFAGWLRSHGLDRGPWSALVHPEDPERQKEAVHANLTYGYDIRVPGVRAWVLRVGIGMPHGRLLEKPGEGSVVVVVDPSLERLGRVLHEARFGGIRIGGATVRFVRGDPREVLRAMGVVGKVWPDLWASLAILANEFGIPEEEVSIDTRVYRNSAMCHVYDVK